ncbi:MAG: sulfotransferase [Pseudomonadota bacterium]
MALPDFVIVGAMKCATSTLFDQLCALPVFEWTEPKEPEFFSDDAVFARGLAWYEGLFAGMAEGSLKGEASTGYSKRPTYPLAVERLAAAVPGARIVYVVRDPFERLVSQFIHEWTQGVMQGPLDAALERHPELIDYSRYHWQIVPYVETFGRERICVTSQEAVRRDGQGELERVARFLGHAGPVAWVDDLGASNVSAERIRTFPLKRLVVDNPVAGALRRALVPKGLREAVKRRLQMRERPVLSVAARDRLAPVFAEEMAALAALFPEAPLPPVDRPARTGEAADG